MRVMFVSQIFALGEASPNEALTNPLASAKLLPKIPATFGEILLPMLDSLTI